MIITIDLKTLNRIGRLSTYNNNVYKLRTKLRDADLIRHKYIEASDMSIVQLCTEIKGQVKTLQTFTDVEFKKYGNDEAAILEIYL